MAVTLLILSIGAVIPVILIFYQGSFDRGGMMERLIVPEKFRRISNDFDSGEGLSSFYVDPMGCYKVTYPNREFSKKEINEKASALCKRHGLFFEDRDLGSWGHTSN